MAILPGRPHRARLQSLTQAGKEFRIDGDPPRHHLEYPKPVRSPGVRLAAHLLAYVGTIDRLEPACHFSRHC